MATQLSGEQKAAILLRAIGEDAAALVMKSLDPKEIRKLGTFMHDTAHITQEEEHNVLTDFEKASALGDVEFDGKDYIKTILTKALGPEKAARLLESMNSRSYPGLDASGHGVAAALRSAALMTFLRAENILQMLGSYDPERVLFEANRRFPMSADGEYFTLWVGQLHLPTGRLTYAAAGHPGALLCSAEGPSRWLTRASFPLGIDLSAEFASDRVLLKPGDRLFLLSDGIYEVPSPSGELWGRGRFQAVIDAGKLRPLSATVAACFAEARSWQQAQHFSDDAAVMGLALTEYQEAKSHG